MDIIGIKDCMCIISIALEVMKIFLLFYMCHFAMDLTHCYKTTVFLAFIFAVFLLNLSYGFRQTLRAISISAVFFTFIDISLQQLID